MMFLRSSAIALVLLASWIPAGVTIASEKSPSASGPIVPGEADLLWNRAQEQLEAHQTEEAIQTLRRLVDRVPTHSRAIRAQALLGQLELERGRAGAALEYFKIAQNNLRGEGAGARELDLLRARAYLALGKYSEALLTSEKLLRDAESGRIRWAVDAQIIKTRALLLLKNLPRAESSLAAARRRPLSDSLNTQTAALWLEVAELQVMESQCARYPSARRLTEEQVIDQTGRHADCVIRAKSQYEKITTQPQPTSFDGKQALTDAAASWARIRRHLEETCENPPLPMAKVSSKQLEIYQSELKLAIQPACSKLQVHQ